MSQAFHRSILSFVVIILVLYHMNLTELIQNKWIHQLFKRKEEMPEQNQELSDTGKCSSLPDGIMIELIELMRIEFESLKNFMTMMYLIKNCTNLETMDIIYLF